MIESNKDLDVGLNLVSSGVLQSMVHTGYSSLICVVFFSILEWLTLTIFTHLVQTVGFSQPSPTFLKFYPSPA